MQNEFSGNLKKWYKVNKRSFPWKADKDPYKIWVSEIILQQTRVAQGTPYFIKFIKAFPQLSDLASTTEEKLFSIWEGLGYYRRAKNMHKGAKFIMNEFGGHFPQTYDELLLIPGVGPYTAAAIGSFAFNIPEAVVDGNVIRVMARYYDIVDDMSLSKGKKAVKDYAQKALQLYANPAEFNQAIMDFGATQCKPKPDCTLCPMSTKCKAKHLNKVEFLPVTKKKKAKQDRYFHYMLIQDESQILLQKRKGNDVWEGLFEFPLLETKSPRLTKKEIDEFFPSKVEVLSKSEWQSQLLSHQKINAKFYKLSTKIKSDHRWILAPKKDLSSYAFPRIVRQYIDQMK